MNNAVRTVIVIYIIAFLTICIFYIPCKQFTFANDDVIFTGIRDTYSIIEMYQIRRISTDFPFFYYIDWQLLYIELLPLTVLAVGTSLILKK